MTEEEKKKQEGQEEENEDLKVVMPEANKTDMTQHEFKEEPDYLVNFANFYIAKFDESDLEIINTFDEHHDMVDINLYLTNNIDFPRKKLITQVLDVHDYNFQRLLDEIKAKTGLDPESLKTYEDWDHWYSDQRGQIPQSLS